MNSPHFRWWWDSLTGLACTPQNLAGSRRLKSWALEGAAGVRQPVSQAGWLCCLRETPAPPESLCSPLTCLGVSTLSPQLSGHLLHSLKDIRVLARKGLFRPEPRRVICQMPNSPALMAHTDISGLMRVLSQSGSHCPDTKTRHLLS